MRKLFFLLFPFIALSVSAAPTVVFETSLGKIVIALDEKRAPATVENFLRYVQSGFYDGTIFHRVIANFVIQGGGYDERYLKKPTHGPIANEAQNGLSNLRGTIAMARSNDPHSATTQFFINLVDNPSLDPGGVDTYGYTVFGQVTSGMEVVEKIAALETGAGGAFTRDVPKTPVILKAATLLTTKSRDAAVEQHNTASQTDVLRSNRPQ